MPVKTTSFIRRAERDDLDTIVGWMEDPDFARFLYGDPARSQKQIREQIVALLGRTQGHTMPGGIYLLIDNKETGPVGMLSLQHISWRNRCCAIDLYMGAKALRSRIVAGIATYRAIEYCFDELNLHRVQAFIYNFNTPSWRLFEKTGAVRELTLHEHVAREGQFHDVYGYGLLRREFDAFRQDLRFRGASLQDMIAALQAEDTAAEQAESAS
ncbi:MAG: GNAT family N-acetyltransferase [Candidatus Hydrogenedentota bacterium]